MMTTRRQQIQALERLANSRNGNPRYRVHFTDGSFALTAVDSSVAYVIDNRENAGDIDVTYDERGNITHVTPHITPATESGEEAR